MQQRGAKEVQRIDGLLRSAIDRYHMIEEGDRIGVGVSGGKDSMVLLTSLARLRAYLPKRFELVALTMDPCFGGEYTDYTPIARLCGEMGVEYILKRTQLGQIVFEQREEANPCSLCAKLRRGILHNMAKEAGCNRLALGHHFDDAAETFVMNLFYGGKIGCFSPVTWLDRKELTLIRPMIFVEERLVRSAAKKESLPVVKSRCPVDGNTKRQEIKDLLWSLEKDYDRLRIKIVGALQRAGIDGW